MIGSHCFFVPFYKKFNNNLYPVESKFDVEKRSGALSDHLYIL